MSEPAYVAIAGEIARDIRSGALPARMQLPSYSELAKQHGVSEIVIRKVIDLLLRQGLVYTIERRGTFVAARPTLVRVSPERQMEDPEVTFGNEAAAGEDEVRIERESSTAPADDELAALLGIAPGDDVEHIITMASEQGRPISISDSYQRPGTDVTAADILEETLADRPPVPTHAVWLEVPSGELVKAVRQRFLKADGQVLMVSDVSYPRDRYESFVFRMALDTQP
ncbi:MULTISPECIES: GntR family transcriptional regulator [Nocardia]|uniref:GntR family transcriptional regulator n=1 Tax=Nocardia TaxID=1817 RepID=UPI000593E33B|nr:MULTISPECIES: GntR family transcriptional regulator [Nocardia]MBF6468877.1 GntR family transcriptional regulator [Nocardia beijingensis]